MSGIGIGIGIWKGGKVYDPAASALFARMTTQPSGARKTIINNFIKGLKSDSIWDLLDVFVITAAHDSQAALLNWKSTSFNGTAVNSPTFTADQGFTGDGISMYINSGWKPSDGVNYSQDNASVGLYCRTNIDENKQFMSCNNAAVDGITINLGGVGAPLRRVTSRLNSQVATGTIGQANNQGLYYVKRTTSTQRTIGKNGSNIENLADTSVTSISLNVYVLAGNVNGTPGNYITNQIAMYFMGAGSINQLNLFNRVETYMDAIGAGVV